MNKKIFFILLIILYQSSSFGKSIDNLDFNPRYLSNYFSAILSQKNQENENALKYFNNSKSLLNKHESYFENLIFSLVMNGKLKSAIQKIKLSDENKVDFFDAQLLLLVDAIQKKNFVKAKIITKDLNKFSSGSGYDFILSETLKDFVNVFLEKEIDLRKRNKFGTIDDISLIFQSCYLNLENTGYLFNKLLSSPDQDYSRYTYFYLNYLSEKNQIERIKQVTKSLSPINSSLIISQSMVWIKNGQIKKLSEIFSCTNEANLISELFFLISNLYAVQNIYDKSNFYLILSNYLNSNFKYNNTLLIENYIDNKKYKLADRLLKKISKDDIIYNWYKIKKKTEIINELQNQDKALNYIQNQFSLLKTDENKILYDMAGIYKNFKKYNSAIELYTYLLKSINPKSDAYADILYRRGGSYERIKDFSNADKDLLKSLEISNNNAYVTNYLAYSWLERNYNIDQALNMLKEANKSKKDDPYITDSLGWGYFLIKDYVVAEKHLRRAVELMPYDPIVNDHYGDILWMLKRKVQARYFWKSVLTLEETSEEMRKKIENKIIFGVNS